MSAAPKQDRLISIDALRGVAVLGILMMNIQAFAMIPEAYQNPLAHMDMTGLNADVWAISHTFFNMKFITIFSALFGAGIILMVGEDGTTGVHYRRMIWLLIIGLIHAYVFWFGDILVPYAVFGMLAVMARKWSVPGLLTLGLSLIALAGILMVGSLAALQLVPADMDMDEMGFSRSPEELAAWVDAYSASFASHIPGNAMMAIMSQIGGMIFFGGRIIGVMFVGMALFKTGFFSASWSSARYLITALLALTIGLGISSWGTQDLIASNFDLTQMWRGEGANYLGSLFAALGYAATVMLICKAGVFGWIVHVFAATGRMAFTNYLAHTLIMTFIFVGAPGLGLIGTVERVDQAKLVMAVWVVQLIWSPLWLSQFRFGPLEWVWRSLTYGRFQPLRKRSPAAADAAGE
jgi:uncharacterized protein